MDTTIGLSLVPILVALTEVVKRVGVPSKWLPLVAVVLGIGFNLVFKMMGVDIAEQIMFGIAAGLGSSGLFDLGSKTILGK